MSCLNGAGSHFTCEQTHKSIIVQIKCDSIFLFNHDDVIIFKQALVHFLYVFNNQNVCILNTKMDNMPKNTRLKQNTIRGINETRPFVR